MDDHAPRLVLGRFRPVDLARVLLVVLPSVPGLLFILVGIVRDPHRGRWRDSSPAPPAEEVRATEQARGLYLAGAATLVAGTFGMAAVVWKIARTRPEDEGTSSENNDRT